MNFYLIFHHNLAFSSIPEEHYPYLIDSVYTGILNLVEAGYPLGLEYTGETLEIIHRLRPQYIEKLRAAWSNGACEIIGLSYSQAIFPLIPVEVNRWNLAFGKEVFERLLGHSPKIAYLNEQVYSESLPALYHESGVKAIVFDWMSAISGNDWPAEYRYQMVHHAPSSMHFLWSDSIAFQKLQRTVWGDIEVEEWLQFIVAHQNYSRRCLGKYGHFCLYASDAEVFDYYPGRLTTCGAQQGHFTRLRKLLDHISVIGGRLVTPGTILSGKSQSAPTVSRVATAAYPARTKKQDKYNITRWAVTGREATKMNTQCHQLLKAIRHIDPGKQNIPEVIELKKALVSLWGSDFRTHTTDEKYEAFRNKMGKALADGYLMTGKAGLSGSRSNSADLRTDGKKSHWALLNEPARNKFPNITQHHRRFSIIRDGIELTLLKNRGLAVESLKFSPSDDNPLVGTIAHGYFADISLGSDFYSGHLLLVTKEGQQYTDLSCTIDELEVCESSYGLGLRNHSPMELPGLSIIKTFWIRDQQLSLVYDLYANNLTPASLRLGTWTLLPWSFDRNTLYYQCYQGGNTPERYDLNHTGIQQDIPVNPVVTARHCLGNTSGVLRLGDANKWFEIQTTASELYSVPLLHHEKSPSWEQTDSFFERVYYSICERDDVASVFWKGHLRISFILTASCKGNSSS